MKLRKQFYHIANCRETVSVMTSDDSLLLILGRLDEIERKLDHLLEELLTPTAIGYSARRGNRPRKD
jgi:hypothetical protein